MSIRSSPSHHPAAELRRATATITSSRSTERRYGLRWHASSTFVVQLAAGARRFTAAESNREHDGEGMASWLIPGSSMSRGCSGGAASVPFAAAVWSPWPAAQRAAHLLLRRGAPAASGRQPMAARTGSPFRMASSRPPRSARWPSRRPTRTSIYAGTGETTIRIDVSHGDGVYRSTDAGRSWTHVGLRDTRHIGKIRVHPHEPGRRLGGGAGSRLRSQSRSAASSRATTAARPGETCSSSATRPARSISASTPTNPRILYAAIWEAHRSFWQISSGGPDSGLWRSRATVARPGGDLTGRPGLPSGILGKIGVAASPARSGRVWALIEHATEGGLYRSDDYGEHVGEGQRRPEPARRAWYYIHLTADPLDADTVYVNNLKLLEVAATAARPSPRSPPRTATTTISGSIRRTTGA